MMNLTRYSYLVSLLTVSAIAVAMVAARALVDVVSVGTLARPLARLLACACVQAFVRARLQPTAKTEWLAGVNHCKNCGPLIE